MRSRALSLSVLAGAQLAVGAAAIFARFALHGAGPLAVAALRLLLASAVFAAASLLWPEPERTTATQRRIFLLAGLALAVHFGAWIWSLQYTSVAISTLLVATTPIWTALYDAAVHRRSLGAAGYAAFAAGAFGLYLVARSNVSPPPIAGLQPLGAGLAVLGAMAIGAYFILVREVRAAFETRSIVRRTYAWAAAALIAAALIAHQPPPRLDATDAWAGILAMALISQVLGHTGMNAALRWFSPSAVAFSTLVEPVIAGLLALLIFGERLMPAALAGGALILAAVAVFLRYEPQSAAEWTSMHGSNVS